MASSDDDYMSENILNESHDLRGEATRKHLRDVSIFKKAKEENFKKSKLGKKLMEEIARDKLLNTKIKEDNIGYKLLQKMGYKPGFGIGKNESGVIDPITVEIKRDRGGVGKQKSDNRIKIQHSHVNNKYMDDKNQAYKSCVKDNLLDREKRKDFRKIQRTCRDLDMRNNVTKPINNFYWPPIFHEKNEQEMTKLEELVASDHIVDPDMLDTSEIQNFIEQIWQYLKEKYFYCHWCGCFYTDIEDFMLNCPGSLKHDHDYE